MKKLLISALVLTLLVSFCLVGLTGCESNDAVDDINFILEKEIGTIWLYGPSGKLANEIYLKGEEFGYKSSVGKEGYVIKENGALVSYIYNNDTWTKYSDEASVNKIYNIKHSLMSFKSNISFEKSNFEYGGGEYYTANRTIRVFYKDGKIQVYKEGELYIQLLKNEPKLVVHQD